MTRQNYAYYHEDDVQTGETYKQCPVTGNWFRVTEWVERQNDRIVALEKEEVHQSDVPRGDR